ncbi:MAG TPA: hypothetical protein DD670_14805 [Planctomycetaceae bacterium]|nr:hypothetical protein [Planctomycetaceae bacterium]
MPDILIRDLDSDTLKRLKLRAKQHGRSLQGELKTLIERAARVGRHEVAAMLDGWEKRFGGRKFSGSAGMVREDRRR